MSIAVIPTSYQQYF